MKNVRIFYKKLGRMKFISHLDMTRFMARLIKKAKIPVWYTEGFNQHIYLNFAVPLSLGFESLYEILDIRITDDNFSNEECLNSLNEVCPTDIEFFCVAEPIMNMKEIAFSDYILNLNGLNIPKEKLTKFLQSDSILCKKIGKKGKIKEIDLIPKIKSFEFDDDFLNLRLVCGNEDNLNPSLVMNTFFSQTDTAPFFYTVTRTLILDKNEKPFK